MTREDEYWVHAAYSFKIFCPLQILDFSKAYFILSLLLGDTPHSGMITVLTIIIWTSA